MPAVTNATLTSFEVAKQLNVHPVFALRAIGRGWLPASRVKPGAPWVVTDAALQKFAAAIPADFITPDISITDPSWFGSIPYEALSRGFTLALLEAMKPDAVPNDKIIRQLGGILPRDRPTVLRYPCPENAAVLKVLNDPHPKGRFAAAVAAGLGRPDPIDRFSKWGQIWLTVKARRWAKSICEPSPSALISSFDCLYGEGPIAFQSITKKVVEGVMADVVSLQFGAVSGKSERYGDEFVVQVVYDLPAAKIATSQQELIDLAF